MSVGGSRAPNFLVRARLASCFFRAGLLGAEQQEETKDKRRSTERVRENQDERRGNPGLQLDWKGQASLKKSSESRTQTSAAPREPLAPQRASQRPRSASSLGCTAGRTTMQPQVSPRHSMSRYLCNNSALCPLGSHVCGLAHAVIAGPAHERLRFVRVKIGRPRGRARGLRRVFGAAPGHFEAPLHCFEHVRELVHLDLRHLRDEHLVVLHTKQSNREDDKCKTGGDTNARWPFCRRNVPASCARAR